MAFFGNISYNDWSIHSNKDMRISIYKVKGLNLKLKKVLQKEKY